MRRLFVLLMLIGLFVVLMPQQATKADPCTCWSTYAGCIDDAVMAYEVCAYSAELSLTECLANHPPNWCYPLYDSAMASCMIAYMNSSYSCDAALNSCLSGCGGGGGGGGALCNVNYGQGYSQASTSFYASLLDPCISEGGSAFTGMSLPRDGFDNCMTNSGGTNQAFCCRAQIDAIIDANAGCNLDPRNSDCKACVSY